MQCHRDPFSGGTDLTLPNGEKTGERKKDGDSPILVNPPKDLLSYPDLNKIITNVKPLCQALG